VLNHSRKSFDGAKAVIETVSKREVVLSLYSLEREGTEARNKSKRLSQP
jgi:hypothetical protein